MGEALAEAQLARRARRAPDRRGRRRRRGDGRPGPRPGPGDRTTHGPRRRRRPARGRPQARPDRARRRHDLRDPGALRDVRRGAARERRRGARLRASRTRATARPAPSSSSPSTRRCRAGSRSSAASAATRREPCGVVRRRRSRRLVPVPRPGRSSEAESAPAGEDPFGILSRGEVSEWLMVPLSKSGVRKHRGFESRPLRHSASLTHRTGRSSGRSRRRPRRGRLVDYGAALEMRFGATRRGFESRPLRHPTPVVWAPAAPVLAHAPECARSGPRRRLASTAQPHALSSQSDDRHRDRSDRDRRVPIPGPELAGRRGVVMSYAVRHHGGVLSSTRGSGSATRSWTTLPAGHPADREALGEVGITRDDVTAVVNCHLHADHAGQNAALGGVPIHVQSAEWELAHTTDHTILEWIERRRPTYLSVDGDHEIARQIRLVATPGHTRGHQSLVVDTPDGPVVLAGQACLHGRRVGGRSQDALEGRADAPDQAAYDLSIQASATWVRSACSSATIAWSGRPTSRGGPALLSFRGRARRGTSGAL